MISNNIILFIFFILLTLHYLTQKKWLINGLKKEDCLDEIKKLSINAFILFFLSFTLLMIFTNPYGIIGIFLLIECGVCFSFAKKLIKR
tara:strand:+ start:705 stop:971 length:267 start_codon:yes stop_codon:yes gene_type:complete